MKISKYSAVLRSKTENFDVGQSTINLIKKGLSFWGDKKTIFAEKYIQDDRKAIEFLHDVVAIAKYLSKLPKQCELLLNIREPTLLMHNRLIAQSLYEYITLGYEISPNPTNFIGNKRHDFNISNFRCEVKTIQTLGKLERTVQNTVRLTSSCEKSLILNLREDLGEALTQVGTDGIVFIAPWSYRFNAVLKSYFDNQLLYYPPPLQNGLVILVLTSTHSFENYYVSFPIRSALSVIENMFTAIQAFGVQGFILPIYEKALLSEPLQRLLLILRQDLRLALNSGRLAVYLRIK